MVIQQLFQQALLCYQQAKYAEASILLKRITTIVPTHPAGWHLFALTLRKLGQLEDSERCFNKSLQLAPSDADLLNNFANLKRQQRKLSEAEQLFRQATKLNPTFVDAWLNLAQLLSSCKRHSAASGCLRTVLNIQPCHKAAILALAREYIYTAQGELATELLYSLTGALANDVDIAIVKAELLRKQGFFIQAIAELSAWPDHYYALKEVALCHHVVGNIDLAQEIISKQLHIAPTDPALLHFQAELRWQNADANWLESYQIALSQYDAAPLVYLEYANKLQKIGDLSKAEQVVDIGLQYAANNPGLLLLKAYLRREAGAFDDALQWLTKNIANAVDTVEAKSEQVITLLAMQRYQQATLFAQQLCLQQPVDQACWALLAACYKFSNDHYRYRQLYNFDRFIGVFNLTAPSGFSDIAVFNRQLLQKLQSLHVNSQHPLQQSLRQGTQTEDHLFFLQDDVIQLLQQQISTQVALYITSLADDNQHPFLQRKADEFRYSGAWSVMLRKQGFHRNHYHGDGWISGCYYVSIPDAVNNAGSGWIKFGQADMSKYLTHEPDYMLKPEAGLLVLFPSMMWHGTEPFIEDKYRVTVAFDIVPKEQEDE